MGWPRTSGDDPELTEFAFGDFRLAPHERG